MKLKKVIVAFFVLSCCLLGFASSVSAAEFDPVFYATLYPGVVEIMGGTPDILYSHYLNYGMKEGRFPYAGALPGEKVTGIKKAVTVPTMNTNVLPPMVAPTSATGGFVPVPINKLANYKSIKKKMTDAEFQMAYNAALQIVTPLAGKSREEQVRGIATTLRNITDSGIQYSMWDNHYNDPYGFFILGTASCAGCARATGLCLNILGMPYEHVNENQYSHQWCRVNVNGAYWICDAFGLAVGPEPAPYFHPCMY